MHILLIDDSSSTRSLLRTLINAGQAERHEISEASSGEEALQKIASGEISLPDIAIIDLNMGGMSGYEVCREFRRRPEAGSDVLPYIIIVTANEGVDVINEALDAGANDYMPKPVNVKILHVRLRVAERLLAHGLLATATSALPKIDPGSVADSLPKPTPDLPPAPSNPRQLLMVEAIEQTDMPIALVEAGGVDASFRILYTNTAMTSTTQFDRDQLVGKSLAELEAWTPEFLKMTMGFVARGAILSHVPLWSKTRQETQVYLSFCPVRSNDDMVDRYLIIHHF